MRTTQSMTSVCFPRCPKIVENARSEVVIDIIISKCLFYFTVFYLTTISIYIHTHLNTQTHTHKYAYVYTHLYIYIYTVVALNDKVKKAQRNQNPRPIIPTMAVSVLSNNSQSYVACPPNSREVSHFSSHLNSSHLTLSHLTSSFLALPFLTLPRLTLSYRSLPYFALP